MLNHFNSCLFLDNFCRSSSARKLDKFASFFDKDETQNHSLEINLFEISVFPYFFQNKVEMLSLKCTKALQKAASSVFCKI